MIGLLYDERTAADGMRALKADIQVEQGGSFLADAGGGTRYPVRFGRPNEEKGRPLRRDFIRLAKTAEAL